MINKAILCGFVGQDPVTRGVGDTKVAQFSLATSRHYKDRNGDKKKETQWHNIVVWGKQAEIVEKYVRKGSCLEIIGEINYREYEKDGTKRHVTDIRAQEMVLLPSGGKDNQLPPENMPPQPDDDLPY